MIKTLSGSIVLVVLMVAECTSRDPNYFAPQSNSISDVVMFNKVGDVTQSDSINDINNFGDIVDLSGCTEDLRTGLCCLEKADQVDLLENDLQVDCSHKETKQCHYSYTTQYKATMEQVCNDIFHKKCQITFTQKVINETVNKCYTPIEKVCNGQGESICKTLNETTCFTSYIEKSPGKFTPKTACEKNPIKLCGTGCIYEEGDEVCHDIVVHSVTDIPEEVCKLDPQTLCKHGNKLVPLLEPSQECTNVPQEVCVVSRNPPRPSKKPFTSRWCRKIQEPLSSYGQPSQQMPNSYRTTGASYGAPTGPPLSSYLVPGMTLSSPSAVDFPSSKPFSTPIGGAGYYPNHPANQPNQPLDSNESPSIPALSLDENEDAGNFYADNTYQYFESSLLPPEVAFHEITLNELSSFTEPIFGGPLAPGTAMGKHWARPDMLHRSPMSRLPEYPRYRLNRSGFATQRFTLGAGFPGWSNYDDFKPQDFWFSFFKL